MPEVPIGSLDDYPDGALTPTKAGDEAIVVGRQGDEVCVALDKCPHLGWRLSRGPGGIRFEDGVVQCPWHNSSFRLCSGENIDWAVGFAGRGAPTWSHRLIAFGRTPSPLTTYPARVEDGQVVVELP